MHVCKPQIYDIFQYDVIVFNKIFWKFELSTDFFSATGCMSEKDLYFCGVKIQIGYGIDLLYRRNLKRLDRLRHRFTNRFFMLNAVLYQYSCCFST